MAQSELVRVAGIRCSIEECFQAATGQIGLDHYQVRQWTAWHRHITLGMLALASLAAPRRPADANRHARNSEPISLTGPEIRHLLAAIFRPLLPSAGLLPHWSAWRRQHQATARRSHYRRRLLKPIDHEVALEYRACSCTSLGGDSVDGG